MESKRDNLKNFFLLLVGTIIATKIWVVSIWFIFQSNPEYIKRIIYDSIHHYQVGIFLLLLAYPLKNLIRQSTLLAIGLGIVLEEIPVLLDDLGLRTLKYYNSGWDILFIFVIIFLTYKLLSVVKKTSSKELSSCLTEKYINSILS